MKWLVTGASGLLGSFVMEVLRSRGDGAVGWTHRKSIPNGQTVDIRDAPTVFAAMQEGFDACIHTAADPNVISCEAEPEAANVLNAEGTRHVSEACDHYGIRLVHVSTDYVFDGKKGTPYVESDERNPLQAYGRTKAAAEDIALTARNVLVARIPLLYGRFSSADRSTWLEETLAALRNGHTMTVDAHAVRQPAWTRDVARSLVELGSSEASQIVHVAPDEAMTRYQWTLRVADAIDASPALVQPSHTAVPDPVRPHRAELESEKLRNLGLFVPRGATVALREAIDSLT